MNKESTPSIILLVSFVKDSLTSFIFFCTLVMLSYTFVATPMIALTPSVIPIPARPPFNPLLFHANFLQLPAIFCCSAFNRANSIFILVICLRITDNGIITSNAEVTDLAFLTISCNALTTPTKRPSPSLPISSKEIVHKSRNLLI